MRGHGTGWKHHSSMNDVELYTKSVRSHVSGQWKQLNRGVGILHFPIEVCAALVEDTAKKDEHFERSHCIARYDRMNTVQYSAFKSIYGSKPRDFVMRVRRARLPNGDIMMSSYSTEHHEGPEHRQYIRGELIVGGFLFERIDDRSCRCSYLVCFDPKGWFPPFAVNLVAKKQPLVIDRLRTSLRDPVQYAAALARSKDDPFTTIGERPAPVQAPPNAAPFVPDDGPLPSAERGLVYQRDMEADDVFARERSLVSSTSISALPQFARVRSCSARGMAPRTLVRASTLAATRPTVQDERLYAERHSARTAQQASQGESMSHSSRLLLRSQLMLGQWMNSLRGGT